MKTLDAWLNDIVLVQDQDSLFASEHFHYFKAVSFRSWDSVCPRKEVQSPSGMKDPDIYSVAVPFTVQHPESELEQQRLI